MSRGATPHPYAVGVVGGGIIGMSLAWRLAQRGWSVTVFDKGQAGGEASWAGAGMLSPGGEVEHPCPVADLLIESRSTYPSFVRELEAASGTRIDYQECGALELAYSREEAGSLENKAGGQAEIGIRSKPVSKQEIASFWPRVRRQDLCAARFYAGDAIVNPRDILVALKAASRPAGILLRENCRVERVSVERQHVELRTDCGEYKFRTAVIAAGAWSGAIAVEGTPALPASKPIKGHLIGYQQPEQTCSTIVRRAHTYLLQRANGLLIAGASVEDVGFDPDIRPDIGGSLAREAAFLLPHLGETSPSEIWVGFRPAADHVHIGAWHSPQLYLAYGHYRNGILLAPLTAQRLADEITANLQKQ